MSGYFGTDTSPITYKDSRGVYQVGKNEEGWGVGYID